MKRKSIILIALVIALSLPASAMAAKKVLRLGVTPQDFIGAGICYTKMAEYIFEKTNGEIEVKVFFNGQLGSDTSTMEQCQAGTLEMAAPNLANISTIAIQTSVLDLPFLWPDEETYFKVMQDKEFQERIWGYLPKRGVVGIGWNYNNGRDLSNTKRPITKPEDLKGLKFRVMQSPMFLDTFKALGAEPVPLAFSELYTALQQGVVDGQDNPAFFSTTTKLVEVVKYMTYSSHTYNQALTIVNIDIWNGLTKEQQQIFYDAAAYGYTENIRICKEQLLNVPGYNADLETVMKENNVQTHFLTPEERQAFVVAVQPVWDKYSKAFKDDVLEFTLSKIEEHKTK